MDFKIYGKKRLMNALKENDIRCGCLIMKLGIGAENWREILEVPAEDLLKALSEMNMDVLTLAPVADGVNIPYNESGEFYVPAVSEEIPILVGASEDEMGAFIEDYSFLEGCDIRQALLKGRTFSGEIPCREENVDAIISAIKERERIKGKQEKSAEEIYVEALSMGSFLGGGAYGHALSKAKVGKAPAFFYMITYDSVLPFMEGKACAWHIADLPLQFRIVWDPASEKLSWTMAHAWAAFIRTGDPSTDERNWPAFSVEEPNCMVIDETFEVELDPYRELREAYQIR